MKRRLCYLANMFKYLNYSVLLAVIMAGLWFVIRLSTEEQPRVLLPMQSDSQISELADRIASQVAEGVLPQQHLFWGMQPGNTSFFEVFTAVRDSLKQRGQNFDTVVIDVNLEAGSPQLQGLVGERMDTKLDVNRLQEGLLEASRRGLRLMVILPPVYADSGLAGSPAALLKSKGVRFTSILQVPFPRSREDEATMPIPCNVSVRDEAGTANLGCEILMKARLAYSRKFPPGEWVSSVVQTSKQSLLFLLTSERAKP